MALSVYVYRHGMKQETLCFPETHGESKCLRWISSLWGRSKRFLYHHVVLFVSTTSKLGKSSPGGEYVGMSFARTVLVCGFQKAQRVPTVDRTLRNSIRILLPITCKNLDQLGSCLMEYSIRFTRELSFAEPLLDCSFLLVYFFNINWDMLLLVDFHGIKWL
jgi:hypothetical protein